MNKQRGFSLIELVVMSILTLMVGALLLVGIGHFRNIIYQHTRLAQITTLQTFNYEIARSIRNARRIKSVNFDRLELEVYNYADYGYLDRGAIENPRRLVYRYDATVQQLVRELYDTADPLTGVLIAREPLLQGLSLFPPTSNPNGEYFFSSHQSATGVDMAVKITIHLYSPFFRQKWTPFPVEAGTYGKGI